MDPLQHQTTILKICSMSTVDFQFVRMATQNFRQENTSAHHALPDDYNNEQHRDRGNGIEDDLSKKSEETKTGGYDMEKMESQRQGSVYRPVIGDESKYKVLNRWHASLIYITNQVGIGILSLPAAMQVLGLIPGIICIIGMGILGQ